MGDPCKERSRLFIPTKGSKPLDHVLVALHHSNLCPSESLGGTEREGEGKRWKEQDNMGRKCGDEMWRGMEKVGSECMWGRMKKGRADRENDARHEKMWKHVEVSVLILMHSAPRPGVSLMQTGGSNVEALTLVRTQASRILRACTPWLKYLPVIPTP